MRRNQRGVYVRQRKVVPETSPIPADSTRSHTTNPRKSGFRGVASLFLPQQKASSAFMQDQRSLKSASGHSSRIWKITSTKAALKVIVLANATLSWVVTILGYFVIVGQEQSSVSEAQLRNGLKSGICFLSIIQTALVVLYWSRNLQYLEAVRQALKLSPVPIRRLRKNRKNLFGCAMECALHLIVLLPKTDVSSAYTLFGVRSSISPDDVLFLVVLCRNYHTVQVIYWWSRFSDLRMHHFASVADAELNSVYVMRCHLADHGAVFVLILYGLMVALSSLLQYTVEKYTRDELNVWDDFWIVTSTQATIGYGDIPPLTFSGQFGMLVNCFCGIVTLGFVNSISQNQLTLSLTECSLYSELLYLREKSIHAEPAIVLLQRWWRLMRMRLQKVKHNPVIISFYSFLPKYRGVLTDCQRVKDRRFERQISAFDSSTHSQFRAINEYIAPVRDSHAMVTATQILDILRKEYRISADAQELFKFVQRRKVVYFPETMASFTSTDIVDDRTPSTAVKNRKKVWISGQGFAKARVTALQNLKNRLIREDFCPVSPSELDEPTVPL